MTLPIRCLAVDDKPLALDILTDYIGKVPSLQLLGVMMNPLDALNKVAESPVDLIFLDIQMPELTGLQFMHVLNGRSLVILTTAYPEYALDGFEHDVVDYLLKPISFERFYRSFQKAQARLQSTLEVKSTLRSFLFVRTEHRMQRIDIADILYVEGMQNYTVFHTAAEKVIAHQTLNNAEKNLPATTFVRVHKSFVVALSHISSIERSRIYIRSGQQGGDVIIPIGDSYRDRFYIRLGM